MLHVTIKRVSDDKIQLLVYSTKWINAVW